MSKRIFIFILLLSVYLSVQAQEGNTTDEDSAGRIIEMTDSLQEKIADEESLSLPFTDTVLIIHPIFIEPDTIIGWKNKKEFAYIKNLDSLLKVLQDEENNTAVKKTTTRKSSFMNEFLQAPFFRTFLILLALFFVAVILHHLLKNQAMFKKVTITAPAKEITDDEDDLLQNDFDKLVHQACKLADYRMAVRYLFLKTLQQLNDKNLIDFARDKTNSRYALEVPAQWRNDFSKLILHYEYVWYGNFAVSRQQFETVQQRYSAFLQKI
jgi:hypothetical protein